MADTPVTPDPIVKAENSVVSAAKRVWAKIEEIDNLFNAWVTKVTDGHTTIALVALAVAYWLLPIGTILGFILKVPELATKYALEALAIAVPAVIGAVPYMIGIVLAAFAIVEVVNLLKKVIK
jgi:ABC-type uncharacterized transport system permease subunit